MKHTLLTSLLIALSSTGFASTIDGTFVSLVNPTSTVERTISNSTTGTTGATGLFLGLFQYTSVSGDFYAYCLEAQQVAGSGTFTIDPTLRSAPGNVGGMSQAQANALLLLLGQVANPFSPSLSAVEQAALQIGIWEITRENVAANYNVSTGNVTFANPSNALFLTQAQTFLNAVNAGTGTPYSGAVALTNGSIQDLITVVPSSGVPEPSTWSMLAFGASALVLSRLRK